jgi:hypothetical protein
VRPAEGQDHHAVRLEVQPAAGRGRLHRDLVADALDEHQRRGAADLGQGTFGGPDRGGRATGVAVERPAGELTPIDSRSHGRRAYRRPAAGI